MTEFGDKWHPRTQDAHNEIKAGLLLSPLCGNASTCRTGQISKKRSLTIYVLNAIIHASYQLHATPALYPTDLAGLSSNHQYFSFLREILPERRTFSQSTFSTGRLT